MFHSFFFIGLYPLKGLVYRFITYHTNIFFNNLNSLYMKQFMVELLSYNGFIIMLQAAHGNNKEEVYNTYKAAYPVEQYPQIHRIVVKDIL